MRELLPHLLVGFDAAEVGPGGRLSAMGGVRQQTVAASDPTTDVGLADEPVSQRCRSERLKLQSIGLALTWLNCASDKMTIMRLKPLM